MSHRHRLALALFPLRALPATAQEMLFRSEVVLDVKGLA